MWLEFLEDEGYHSYEDEREAIETSVSMVF